MPGKKIEISDDCLMKQLKLKSYRAFEVVFNAEFNLQMQQNSD